MKCLCSDFAPGLVMLAGVGSVLGCPMVPMDQGAGAGGDEATPSAVSNSSGGPSVSSSNNGGGSNAPCRTSGEPISFTDVAAGGTHTCAVSTRCTVYCWGNNLNGQLGAGDIEDHGGAGAVVKALEGVRSVAAGEHHSCALTWTGEVLCWGANDSWQLGVEGVEPGAYEPVSLPGPAVAIGAGRNHSCAVLATGSVWCWGATEGGKLGVTVSPGSERALPGQVAGLDILEGPITSVALGGQHTCALAAGGALWCWGDNTYEQLTAAVDNDGTSHSPTNIAIDTTVLAVAAGESHTCILTQGEARCWGQNEHGESAQANLPVAPEPVAVSGVTGSIGKVISASHSHTVVIAADSSIAGWGINTWQQLGVANTVEPAEVVFLETIPFVSVSAGWTHTCAIDQPKDGLMGGDIWCWGGNKYGQVGNGKANEIVVPVKVDPTAGGKSIRRNVHETGGLDTRSFDITVPEAD